MACAQVEFKSQAMMLSVRELIAIPVVSLAIFIYSIDLPFKPLCNHVCLGKSHQH